MSSRALSYTRGFRQLSTFFSPAAVAQQSFSVTPSVPAPSTDSGLRGFQSSATMSAIALSTAVRAGCSRAVKAGAVTATRASRPSVASLPFIARGALSGQANFSTSGRKSVSVSVAEGVSAQTYTDEDDFEEVTFDTEPKKGLTFADTLSEESGDLIEIDASVDIVDDSLRVCNPEWNLSKSTVDAVEAKGINALFPIQAAVMRPAMEGRDLIGRARTGSGKTLAFALPVVEKIMQVDRPQRGRPPLCLVLAPTRELAKQVDTEFQSVAPGLHTACFYGGVSIRDQIRHLQRGLDVVVGTPGRIIDLVNRRELDLSSVQHVILDEADQMLAVGFCEDVEQILESVPAERQTLLFSATLPSWVSNITRRFLNDPVTVDTIGESDTGRMSDSITALACQVSRDAKPSVLVDLIAVYGKGNKTIVFTQTKRDADEVCAGLSRQHPCEALHGDISQEIREKTLKRFRDGRVNVLVATDVAARGLDIPNVDLVVHYDLPQESESFLHRSGRTGRAGRKGTAIALLGPSDSGKFRYILRETKAKVDMVGPPNPETVMQAASMQVAQRLDQVDPEVIKFFEPTAERLLQVQDPHHSMAAALAALSGFTEVPKPRSLITQEEGVVTLRLMAAPGQIASPGKIIGVVGRHVEDVGDAIGRIRMLRDGDLEGGAFDVPFGKSADILAHAGALASQGFTLDVPTTLPMELALGNDRRGGRNDRGYNRGGRRNDRGGNYNRGGRRDNFRSNDRYGRNDRNDRGRNDRYERRGGGRSEGGYSRQRGGSGDFDNNYRSRGGDNGGRRSRSWSDGW